MPFPIRGLSSGSAGRVCAAAMRARKTVPLARRRIAARVFSMVRLDASARVVAWDNDLLACALVARSTARAASCAGGKPASTTSHITLEWVRFGPHWPSVRLGGEPLLAGRCGVSAASCRWSLFSSQGLLFDGFGRLAGSLRPFSPLSEHPSPSARYVMEGILSRPLHVSTKFF